MSSRLRASASRSIAVAVIVVMAAALWATISGGRWGDRGPREAVRPVSLSEEGTSTPTHEVLATEVESEMTEDHVLALVRMMVSPGVEWDSVVARKMRRSEWISLSYGPALIDNPNGDVWVVAFKTHDALTVHDYWPLAPEFEAAGTPGQTTATPRSYADDEGITTGYYVIDAGTEMVERQGVIGPASAWQYEDVAAYPTPAE